MNIRNIYITLIIFFTIILFIILYFLFFKNDNYFIELFADTNDSYSISSDENSEDEILDDIEGDSEDESEGDSEGDYEDESEGDSEDETKADPKGATEADKDAELKAQFWARSRLSEADEKIEAQISADMEAESEKELKAGYDELEKYKKNDNYKVNSSNNILDENLNAKMNSNINSEMIAQIETTSKNELDKELNFLIKKNNVILEVEFDKALDNKNETDNSREEYDIESIINSQNQKKQIVIPDEYKCNSDTDDGIKEFSSDYIKNAPCNYSIHKKFMYGCNQLNPFGINESNSYIKDLLDDPSQYYKKLFRPVVANLDDTEYIGSNMPAYSNYSKITDIGKIKLSVKKTHPVPQNYTFKNTPSFNFN